ncbi:ATP-dependent helicase [Patescibacteria group bacterium]
MKSSLKYNYSEILNEQQLDAAQTIDGPLLIAAGPGSGKTRTIIYRTLYMIQEKGIDPKEILLITFTKKAANEMRERLSELIEGDELPFVGTFHSLCLTILRNYAFKIGLEKNFKIYDPTDQIELLQDTIKGAKKKALSDLLKRISKLKNDFISPLEAPLELQEVFRNYEGAMRSKNAVDFDDLIIKTVKLLRKHDEVLNALPFKYISVDEYQDTNKAQYELIKLIASRDKNICVIGDSDQAIYAFRGANVQNFLQFGEDFENVKLVKLDKNYRSTPQIINASDKVIEKNDERMQRDLNSIKEDGALVKIVEANNDRAETDYILQTIDIKMGGISRQSKDLKNIEDNDDARKFSDFAVLYRTHLQGKAIEDAFLKAGIPYQMVGAIPFYDRTEIKDILSYLRCIYDPNDETSMKRTIKKFAKGVGDSTIEKIINYSTVYEIPFYQSCLELDTLSLTNDLKKSLGEFIRMHENFRKYASENKLSDLIKFVLHKITYFETYKDKKRQDHVFELIGFSLQFDDTPPFEGLKAFIDETALMQDKDVYDQTKDAVTLLTMHASKGLEFPIVFIAGASEGLTPYQFNEDEVNEEEERRLFYVGMTRAQEELHIIHANERSFFGDKHEMEPSRFLADIPEEFVEKKEQERVMREKKKEVPDEQESLW